ncbi:hypothetical protein VDG09_04005 [Xanthomonas campestris pv. raphani]|uniref:hypothetical protein n=1 Tax=Xanthomonas campestris TaxID=339 RepID=UPI002B224E1B|nr:hypothetical protein [Xanthomonas campestris]MEA9826821.1 hypothetical protein [Xanthomonas campestris pv. raphani]
MLLRVDPRARLRAQWRTDCLHGIHALCQLRLYCPSLRRLCLIGLRSGGGKCRVQAGRWLEIKRLRSRSVDRWRRPDLRLRCFCCGSCCGCRMRH